MASYFFNSIIALVSVVASPFLSAAGWLYRLIEPLVRIAFPAEASLHLQGLAETAPAELGRIEARQYRDRRVERAQARVGYGLAIRDLAAA